MWWRWYYWGCPVAWSLYGLMATQFGDLDDPMENGQTVEVFVKDYYGYKRDFVGVIAAGVIGFTLLFAFVFALSIKVFNFQRR